MQAFILRIIEKHTPPVVTILMAIGIATWYLGTIISQSIDTMRTDLISQARQPFYLSVEYNLAKQGEKLSKDPADLKTSDIELLSILCNDDFGFNYVPDLPANRRIDAESACDSLTTLYKDRAY